MKRTCGKSIGGFLGLVLLGVALVGGCAAAPKPQLTMAWPEPPDTPRIVFVRTLAGEEDLQGGSQLKDAVDLFLGRQKQSWHMMQPIGVAVSDDGSRVFVSDYSQGMVYVFDFAANRVALLGAENPFEHPVGLTADASGNLYVVEQGKDRVLVFDSSLTLARTIVLEKVERPTGIAIDRGRGLLYVADPADQHSTEHFVRVYDLEGRFLRNLGKGRGTDPGYFQFPTYVAVGAEGEVYVSETINARVSVFDAEGNFLRVLGRMGNRVGEMFKPKGVALDLFGNVYVADSAWSVVQILNPNGEPLLFFGGRHRIPGMMMNPTAVAIDKRNRIYVADTFNFRVNVYDLVNTAAADNLPATAPAKASDAEAGSTVAGDSRDAGGVDEAASKN